MVDQTSATIHVAAEPSAVMDVIADFTAYPDWARGVTSAEIVARGADGRAERVAFRLDAGVVRDEYTLGFEWDDDSEVRWHLLQGQLMTQMDGAYRLTPAEGGTAVEYRLSVALRIPMLGLFKRKAEQTIIDTALKGLKGRVEAPPQA